MKTIFPEHILRKIPIAYRFMNRDETKRIPELYKDTRFSQSAKHRSLEYIFYISHKPISNIDYFNLTRSTNEREIL